MNFFSNDTWLLLDRYGILIGDLLMTATLAAGFAGFIKRNDLRRWLSRNQFPSVGGRPDDSDWQGLIFTVSRAEVPLWVMGQVQPDRLGLLHTEQSRTEAENIKQQAERQGRSVSLQIITDANDPAQAHSLTQTLIREMQEAGIQKIAVDVTGGKTPMSLGAFMAAEETACDTIYVSADNINGKIDMSTAKIIAISQSGH